MRRLKQGAVVLVVILAAAQLIRPGRTNPPTDPNRTIQAHVGTTSPLGPVLDRACGDCHSNRTVWPWYTEVAPLSWVMAYAVKEGRKAVNFAEWAAYPPEQYCRQHDISVIAGACPMMYGDGVDFGHACMRLWMKLTGGLPT